MKCNVVRVKGVNERWNLVVADFNNVQTSEVPCSKNVRDQEFGGISYPPRSKSYLIRLTQLSIFSSRSPPSTWKNKRDKK